MIKLTHVKQIANWSFFGYDPFYDEYVLDVLVKAGKAQWHVFYKVPKEYYDMASEDCEFITTLCDNIFSGNAWGLAEYDLTYIGSTSEAARIANPERWNDPRYDTLD